MPNNQARITLITNASTEMLEVKYRLQAFPQPDGSDAPGIRIDTMDLALTLSLKDAVALYEQLEKALEEAITKAE